MIDQLFCGCFILFNGHQNNMIAAIGSLLELSFMQLFCFDWNGKPQGMMFKKINTAATWSCI